VEQRVKESIGAVILAAGVSSRMGEPKQLLRLGGKTLLEQVLDSARSAAVDEIVVVLGAAAENIRQQVDLSKTKVVINSSYQQGMGTSLGAGLAALDPAINAVLILLADQPFVRPTTLHRICQEYRRSHAQIVIPLYKGFRGNPVLLARSVFPEVMALSGDVGCRAIFGNHLESIVKLPVDDVGILLDIDTKADFDKLQSVNVSTPDKSPLELADLEGREIVGDSAARPELIIVGQEPVALALAQLGALLNFVVTGVDPLLRVTDFPGADRVLRRLDFSFLPQSAERYVVVASKGRFDEEAVEQALHSGSAYVALVANKKRGQEVLRCLEMKRCTAEMLSRVQVPAGIDIGAETPQEIALSIMAAIVQERRREIRKRREILLRSSPP
jgi:molybdenum cofactor cytidylyltransferase